MTRCPFCGLPPTGHRDVCWNGWSSCPPPCARLQRYAHRGHWVLFQLPSPDGSPRPVGTRLVHFGSRHGGTGQAWLVPWTYGTRTFSPSELGLDSDPVPPGRFRQSVRELVDGSPAAAREAVASHVLGL